MVDFKQEWEVLRLKNKKIYLWITVIVGVLLIGAGIWIYQSKPMNGTMTEHEFNQLKDKEMEIVDTSVFLDEELEKWYYENRQVAGEYTYVNGDSTYILVSLGTVENENSFLLLNGVKELDGKLAVGYDTIVMNDVPSIKFEDDIRSTLVKVKGNYDKIHVIDVEEPSVE